MTWIKVEATTPHKPEIVRIARAVGITRDDAFGKMMRFWIWLDGVSVDGRVDGLVDGDVDDLLSCDGIGAAIASVGWIEFDNDNCRILIPNFERHNGETAKGRALKAIRQQKWRQNRDVDVDAITSTPASTPASTREEKRRIKKPPTPFSVPDSLKHPRFERAWADWQAHRAEIQKPLTPTQAAKQLEQFAEWGAPRAVAAIEHTIAKGWQGIREPERNGQPERPEDVYQRMD